MLRSLYSNKDTPLHKGIADFMKDPKNVLKFKNHSEHKKNFYSTFKLTDKTYMINTVSIVTACFHDDDNDALNTYLNFNKKANCTILEAVNDFVEYEPILINYQNLAYGFLCKDNIIRWIGNGLHLTKTERNKYPLIDEPRELYGDYLAIYKYYTQN